MEEESDIEFCLKELLNKEDITLEEYEIFIERIIEERGARTVASAHNITMKEVKRIVKNTIELLKVKGLNEENVELNQININNFIKKKQPPSHNNFLLIVFHRKKRKILLIVVMIIPNILALIHHQNLYLILKKIKE